MKRTLLALVRRAAVRAESMLAPTETTESRRLVEIEDRIGKLTRDVVLLRAAHLEAQRQQALCIGLLVRAVAMIPPPAPAIQVESGGTLPPGFMERAS